MRFYDHSKEKITTELLSVSSLNTNTSTGENIFNMISNELLQLGIPWANVIGFVSDNASVMMGSKKGVISFIRRKQPDIIAIGCPCHLINLAALKAADALPIRMDELLVDIFYYMDKSAKRVNRFKELQSLYEVKVHKILKRVYQMAVTWPMHYQVTGTMGTSHSFLQNRGKCPSPSKAEIQAKYFFHHLCAFRRKETQDSSASTK